jgi:hypothetical protein
MAEVKGKPGRKSRYGRPLTGAERMELLRRRGEFLTKNMESIGYRRFPVFLDTAQLGALWRLEQIRKRNSPLNFRMEESPDEPAFISRMVFLAIRDYLKVQIDRLPDDAPGVEELRALELPQDSFHGAAAYTAMEKLLLWADQRFGKAEGGEDGVESPA